MIDGDLLRFIGCMEFSQLNPLYRMKWPSSSRNQIAFRCLSGDVSTLEYLLFRADEL